MAIGTITVGTIEKDKTAVIAAAGSNSSSVETLGLRAGSFQLPSAMTGTAVAVEVSNDGTNFTQVVEEDAEVNPITVANNGSFVLPIKTFSFRYFRLASNDTEVAERTILVFMRG